MEGRTITRADLSESVFQEVGLSRNESSDLVETILAEVDNHLAGFLCVSPRGKHAGIGPLAVINGMGDHCEIWAPDRWKKYCEENVGRYGDVAATLLSPGARGAVAGSSADGEVG